MTQNGRSSGNGRRPVRKTLLTLRTAPTGQFLESVAYPGLTFFKIVRSNCPGLRSGWDRDRDWKLCAIGLARSDSERDIKQILVACPPETNLDAIAFITHPHGSLPVGWKYSFAFSVDGTNKGGSGLLKINIDIHAPDVTPKPGMARLPFVKPGNGAEVPA